MAFICAVGEARAARFGKSAEGDAVQAVAGRADFLVDLKAVLQRGAVDRCRTALRTTSPSS